MFPGYGYLSCFPVWGNINLHQSNEFAQFFIFNARERGPILARNPIRFKEELTCGYTSIAFQDHEMTIFFGNNYALAAKEAASLLNLPGQLYYLFCFEKLKPDLGLSSVIRHIDSWILRIEREFKRINSVTFPFTG